VVSSEAFVQDFALNVVAVHCTQTGILSIGGVGYHFSNLYPC